MSTRFSVIHQTAIRGHVGAMLADKIRVNIIRLRNERGWSRPELGRRLNPPTSGSQIERLEKGWRSLEVDWVEKLARALRVEPAELMNGDEGFDLTPQVADGVAEHLARIALRGDEPDPAIVQVLSRLLLDLSATFSAHPQARRDPQVALPVIDVLVRKHAERSN